MKTFSIFIFSNPTDSYHDRDCMVEKLQIREIRSLLIFIRQQVAGPQTIQYSEDKVKKLSFSTFPYKGDYSHVLDLSFTPFTNACYYHELTTADNLVRKRKKQGINIFHVQRYKVENFNRKYTM